MISEENLKKMVAGCKVLIDSNIIIYLTELIQPYAYLSKDQEIYWFMIHRRDR